MSIESEQFLNSLTKDEQRDFVGHAFTFCSLSGEIQQLEGRENLFEVVAQMERYIVDTNSNWKTEATRTENRNKAFIIGKTIMDEQDNIAGLLFGPNTNIQNNNIFVMGIYRPRDSNTEPRILLERLDQYYRGVFNEESLLAASKSRRERRQQKDTEFLEYEGQLAAGVENEKQALLLLLGKLKDISELPLPDELKEKRLQFLAAIQREALNCSGDYLRAVNVARHCYALLLMEKLKMRTEFAKPGYLNVFGDTAIIQNALFMRAEILSSDKPLKRMASYAGLGCVSKFP
jgi:hypothetical protein